MPVASEDITKRLCGYGRLEYAPPRDLLRVAKILGVLYRANTLTLRGLIYDEEIRESRIGCNFIIAVIPWLTRLGLVSEERGRQRRRLLSLTTAGEDIILKLSRLFESAKRGSISFMFMNLGGGVLEGDFALEPSTTQASNLSILANNLVFDRVKEVAALIPFINPELGPAKLTLTLKSKSVDWHVLEFQLNLCLFYVNIINNELVEPLPDSAGRLDLSLAAYHSWLEYSKFWWKQLKEVERTHEKFDLSKILPLKILDSIQSNKRVRRWLKKVIDADPNYFMPYFFWKLLGFKSRNEEKAAEIYPPFIRSPLPDLHVEPRFIDRMVELTELLDAIVSRRKRSFEPWRTRRFDEVEGDPYLVLASELEKSQYDADFYKAWILCRDEYKDKLPDISEFLNAASIKFVLSERPIVDVCRALRDISSGQHGVNRCVELIEQDHYSDLLSEKNILRKVLSRLPGGWEAWRERNYIVFEGSDGSPEDIRRVIDWLGQIAYAVIRRSVIGPERIAGRLRIRLPWPRN